MRRVGLMFCVLALLTACTIAVEPRCRADSIPPSKAVDLWSCGAIDSLAKRDPLPR